MITNNKFAIMNPSFVDDAQIVAMCIMDFARGLDIVGGRPVPLHAIASAQRILVPGYFPDGPEAILALESFEELLGLPLLVPDPPQTQQDQISLATHPEAQHEMDLDEGIADDTGSVHNLGHSATLTSFSVIPLELSNPFSLGECQADVEGANTLDATPPGVQTLSAISAGDPIYTQASQAQNTEWSRPAATDPDDHGAHGLQQDAIQTNPKWVVVDDYCRTGAYNHPEVHREWGGQDRAPSVVGKLKKLPVVLSGIDWQQGLNSEIENVRIEAVRVVIQSITFLGQPMGTLPSHSDYIPALAAILYSKFCYTGQSDTLATPSFLVQRACLL